VDARVSIRLHVEAGMSIIYGELLLAFGVILFFVILIGTRNPVKPFWAGDLLLENFYPLVIIHSFFFGIYLLVKGLVTFSDLDFGWIQSVLCIGIPAAAFWIMKRLDVRRRLEKFKAQAEIEKSKKAGGVNEPLPPGRIAA
jgi:hypothetical protein